MDSERRSLFLPSSFSGLCTPVKTGDEALAPTPAAALLVSHNKRFVSRGGLKLEAFLSEAERAAPPLRFASALLGGRVMDVGSSTGGFTDCALQR